jgi:hypothetical protein
LDSSDYESTGCQDATPTLRAIVAASETHWNQLSCNISLSHHQTMIITNNHHVQMRTRDTGKADHTIETTYDIMELHRYALASHKNQIDEGNPMTQLYVFNRYCGKTCRMSAPLTISNTCTYGSIIKPNRQDTIHANVCLFACICSYYVCCRFFVF